MEKPKGKCKTCFGCNILNEPGFKGRKKCKNYIRANDYFIDIVVITAIAIIMMILVTIACIKFNMLAGG